MTARERVDCLCAGIAVADHLCVPIARLPNPGELVVCERLELAIGGCAANVAVDLSRVGLNVGIVARVGADIFGKFLRERLTTEGVCTGYLLESPGSATSGTLILNVRGEDRRYVHAFGANADFDGSELSAEAIQSTRVLYVGGYFAMPNLRSAAVAGWFRTAREAGVLTVLDVVLPGPGDYWDDLAAVLPWTDVFLPNSDEARVLTGLETPLAQAERLMSAGAGTVVVTCGGSGAVLVNAREGLQADRFQVEFVDGTGSGDAFDAGYIYGLLQGADARQCLEYGSALGASCVRRGGATAGVFTAPELHAFLGEQRLAIRALA